MARVSGIVTETSERRNGNHISATDQDVTQAPRGHVTGTGLGLVAATRGSCNGKQPDNETETGF